VGNITFFMKAVTRKGGKYLETAGKKKRRESIGWRLKAERGGGEVSKGRCSNPYSKFSPMMRKVGGEPTKKEK